MGSGEIVLKAIKKHGKVNFSKKVLFVFDNSEDMYIKEAEIVDKEFIGRPDTYNAKVGGYGGWSHMHTNDDAQLQRCAKGGKASWERGAKNYTPPPKGVQPEHFKKANEVRRLNGLTEDHRKNISKGIAKIDSKRMWIYNDKNKRKSVHPDTWDSFKTKGWKACKDDLIKPTLWVHKGKLNTIIRRSQLEINVKAGWSVGRYKKNDVDDEVS